jgi:hypothetical protein
VPIELMRLAQERRHSFVVALDNDPAGERGWRRAWEETADWSGFKIPGSIQSLSGRNSPIGV